MKIKKINRMVVKIGSSLLIDKDKGVNNNFLNNISEDIVSLKKKGHRNPYSFIRRYRIRKN